MTYTFSWYSYDFVTKILHPKWWQMWKRAEIYRELEWVRHCITDIPEDEGKLLLGHWDETLPGASPTIRLIRRLMGQKVDRVQLEHGTFPAGIGYESTGSDGKRFRGTRRVMNEVLSSEAKK